MTDGGASLGPGVAIAAGMGPELGGASPAGVGGGPVSGIGAFGPTAGPSLGAVEFGTSGGGAVAWLAA